MPTLLLDRPIAFPVTLMREALETRVPGLQWRAGEEDVIGAAPTIALTRPQTIIGRAGEGMVLVSVELRDSLYRPANGHLPPSHQMHIAISRASTEDDALARALALVVGATLAINQDEGAWLQLEPGGTWLDTGDMRALLKSMVSDKHLAQRDHYGVPESFDGAAPQRRATPPPEPTPACEKRPALASFSILLDGDVHIDWAKIDEAMNVIDAGGNWSSICVPGGLGIVTGRTNIMCIWSPVPMEAETIADAYGRSFWFKPEDKARVARHRQYVALSVDAPDDFDAKVATAKAVTIMIGLIAQLPQVCAVYNHGVATIFSPTMTHELVGILHSNEVPITLWTWAAPNSLADGDVSVTTGGMEPFVGYEVEVWHAPLGRDHVLEKLNGVLRYLLINGPVIKHGDTIGEAPGDRGTRCFFGPSRADRPQPVQAMFVEFDGEPVLSPKKDLPIAMPRPDPVPQPGPTAPAPPPMRRVGGFGRKGL